jgi:hypothetical protein
MSGGFHVGDNFTMLGNNNVGKVVGNVNPQGVPVPPSDMSNQSDTNVLWREPLVFINFRHADKMAAADIDAELTRRLGSGAVFRDVRMPAGIDFPEELLHRASTSEVMISIIGEKWDDAHGLHLLSDRSDWVRQEIVAALANGVRVVPILVGARRRLFANDLPEDIRRIADLQAPHIRRSYDAQDIRRLADELLRDIPALTSAMFRSR